jgi:hypothetical protein
MYQDMLICQGREWLCTNIVGDFLRTSLAGYWIALVLWCQKHPVTLVLRIEVNTLHLHLTATTVRVGVFVPGVKNPLPFLTDSVD